jgi:hypothetical protein
MTLDEKMCLCHRSCLVEMYLNTRGGFDRLCLHITAVGTGGNLDKSKTRAQRGLRYER